MARSTIDKTLPGEATPLPAPSAATAEKAPTQLRLYGALALGILCIGFSAIFVKWANVPGTVSALYRVVIATVVLALPFGGSSRAGR